MGVLVQEGTPVRMADLPSGECDDPLAHVLRQTCRCMHVLVGAHGLLLRVTEAPSAWRG